MRTGTSPITLSCLTLSCLTMTAVTFAEEKQSIKEMKEVAEVIEVSGRRNQANTEMTDQTKKLMDIPSISNDPLSSVFTLPGIVYAGGDDGEPAIRGSAPDDNAFYIDGMPADYIFHLFGDSIFNKNVIRDFSLYPAGFGSQYSNATGGVIDVTLRDPKNQKLSTTLDASMLKTGVMVEGGVTDNQAFYFSYRRSLMHLFIDEGESDDGEKVKRSPVSDDYQGKYQWLIGDDQKLTFTITGASDVGALDISAESDEAKRNPDVIGEMSLNTKFDQQTLSYQYFADEWGTFDTSFSHMVEQNLQKQGRGQFVDLKTKRYNLRSGIKFNRFGDHQFAIGADAQHSSSDYRYDMIPYFCTDHDADCEDKKGDRVQDADQLKSTDLAVHANATYFLNEDASIQYGLRAEYNDYTKQTFIHPRLSFNWFLTDAFSMNAKAGTYSRFPDIDKALKKLGNPNLKSPKANHYSIGFGYELNDTWNTSIDFYYKTLSDMALSLDSHQDSSLHYSNDLSGEAKGVEWVLNKNLSDGWYGWASLSWSKSNRTNDITKVTTDYVLDTPILANAVVSYQYNEQWDFGLRLTMRSGAKYTPIVGLRDNPDHTGYFLPNYGKLNSKTLPTYYRFDLSANYKTTLWGLDSEVNFAIINATNSKNVSGYSYSPQDGDTYTQYALDKDVGMEMFPSIGLTIKF